MGFQAQALGFQGNGAAAAEWIENWRRMAVCGLENLDPGFIQHLLVIRVFPQDQALDDPKEPLTLLLLSFLSGKLLRAGGRVIDDGGKKDGPACGERLS